MDENNPPVACHWPEVSDRRMRDRGGRTYVAVVMPRNGRLRRIAAATRRRAAAVVVLLAALMLVANVVVAAPVDLEQAEAERQQAAQRQEQLQQDLNVLLTRIEELKAAREVQASEIEQLGERLQDEQATARRAASEVAERYKQAYKTGTGADPIVLMFGGDSPQDVTERARLLSLMAKDSRMEQEAAEGASLHTEALSGELEAATTALADQTAELSDAQREASTKVAQAQAEVDQLDQQIAAERERRAAVRRRRERQAAAAERERVASERAAAAAASTASSGSTSGGGGSSSGGGGSSSGGGGSGSAPVSGGTACPVGTPRSYSDTYGAPRSGGRSHMGVDILAPMRTPIYAYENGTISRMNNSSLGGISLYLQGRSGNQYFYTHLSGYVSGVSAGQSVRAGQHIAYVGDTGNAAGIPHLHWEVQPGGSGNTNPYPYAFRACG